MKNLYIVALLSLICNLNLHSQTKPANFSNLSIPVVNLRKDTLTGTGTFIVLGKFPCIVTAAHVSKFMDLTSYVLLQDESGKAIRLNLTDLSKPIKWIYHPVADLAILLLNPNDSLLNKYLKRRFISLQMIDTSQVALPRGRQLQILGFPLGLGTDGYLSPLTYKSYPSSDYITLKRADTKTLQTFIILENPSVAGYSGGPVFDSNETILGGLHIRNGGIKLRGFIHGTISDLTGGKLTAMTPAFYLRDFLILLK